MSDTDKPTAASPSTPRRRSRARALAPDATPTARPDGATFPAPSGLTQLPSSAPHGGAPRRRAGNSTRRPRAIPPIEIAVLPVRDLVLFPHMVSPLPVGRPRSLRAIEHALAHGQVLCIVAQRDPDLEDVGLQDLHPVGTQAIIGRVLKVPNGKSSVLVQGQRRLRLLEVVHEDPFLLVRAEPEIGRAHV